jgi:hypothetical protein
MLEPGVGAQVIAKPEAITPRTLPTPVQTMPIPERANQDEIRPSGEVPDIPRQFTLTSKTDRILKRLVGTYSEATGMDLKHSELLRAVLVAVEHAMPELVREAQGIGPLRRPKNDRGREAEREDVERRIAKAFLAGMRAAGMMGDQR